MVQILDSIGSIAKVQSGKYRCMDSLPASTTSFFLRQLMPIDFKVPTIQGGVVLGTEVTVEGRYKKKVFRTCFPSLSILSLRQRAAP